jgi:hypothetical protein
MAPTTAAGVGAGSCLNWNRSGIAQSLQTCHPTTQLRVTPRTRRRCSQRWTRPSRAATSSSWGIRSVASLHPSWRNNERREAQLLPRLRRRNCGMGDCPAASAVHVAVDRAMAAHRLARCRALRDSRSRRSCGLPRRGHGSGPIDPRWRRSDCHRRQSFTVLVAPGRPRQSASQDEHLTTADGLRH